MSDGGFLSCIIFFGRLEIQYCLVLFRATGVCDVSGRSLAFAHTDSSGNDMTRIQIFAGSEPVSSSGAIGDFAPSQRELPSGSQVELFDLVKQAAVFDANPVVSDYLERSGAGALPLILVDGEIALAGRFPTQAEFARWLDEAPTLQPVGKQSDCCGGCC